MKMETEFDGVPVSDKKIRGTYKSNKLDEYDEHGTFEFDLQWRGTQNANGVSN